ncbi:MAG TPA: FHA domain-containing protein, partial [Streptosporangiaceae bacterium]|nr:FHA domain-containing protein [Streptosporangiaceae bacterium]
MPGDGVLARQGDLILLSAIDERGLLDSLLDLLAKTSQAGGDGRRYVDEVEDLIEGDETWGAGDEGQPGPAVVAFGPAGAGLAVTVSGTAWAEITTAHGSDRLVAAQPATVLRCVVGVPVYAVRGGLGTGRALGDRTDRFSHLERGTIRAGGLSYHSGLTATSAAAPPPGTAALGATPPPVPDVTALDVAGPDSAAAADIAAPGPTADEAGAWEQPSPVKPSAAPPEAAEPPAAGAAEPEFAEPGAVGPEFAEPGAVEPEITEPEVAEPEALEPDALEPEAVEPEAVEPEAVEPTGLPEADQYHPPTEKAQVPDFAAALAAEQPGAAVPVREATGPAELPPSPDADTPVDALGTAADAPIVLGVYCKNGHFGDPNARSCVVCGVSRGRRGPAPQPGPRPPLGALVLDDGSALELSTDCVVGREPTLDPSVAAGEAYPLGIADAAVSRVHARVHLDGWQVLLIDLGSVNGTRIRLPGKRSEQALEPNVPVPLQSGTRV